MINMGKTKTVMTGILSTAVLIGITGCSNSGTATGSSASNSDIPPVPDDTNCTNWEWDDDDGVWECEDSHSRYYGHYFYGGKYYNSKSSLLKNTSYKKQQQSSSSSSSVSGGSDSTNKTSGFGSGKKSYGG